jgi:hypothetical protein
MKDALDKHGGQSRSLFSLYKTRSPTPALIIEKKNPHPQINTQSENNPKPQHPEKTLHSYTMKTMISETL